MHKTKNKKNNKCAYTEINTFIYLINNIKLYLLAVKMRKIQYAQYYESEKVSKSKFET